MDLQRVSDTEKLYMRIPLHFSGSDIAPGVKISGGMISHQLSEVEVRCFPKDLPEFIEVDLSKLEINQAVHLADLKIASGIEIVDLLHGKNSVVATAYIPRAAVEDAAVAAPSAAVPVIGKEEVEGEEASKEGAKDKGKSDKKSK